MFLSKIEPIKEPKVVLEQYIISVEAAAGMLYLAAYVYSDIVGKAVADLGCGTGRLALGAAWLGAKEVVGIDIDKKTVKQAKDYAKRFELDTKTHWIAGDINAIYGEFDTVLQNPPFGVQKKGADRKFLEKALEIGRSVYSLHKSTSSKRSTEYSVPRKVGFSPGSPSSFLKRFIEQHNGEIRTVYTTVMTIPHMFSFHRKAKYRFLVDLYVIMRRTV